MKINEGLLMMFRMRVNRIQYKEKHRRSIRIKEYDYSKAGMYFITICTQGRRKILSRIDKSISVGADDPVRPILTNIGVMVDNVIKYTEKIYKNVIIDKYIIMPNHLHAVIVIKEGRTESSAPTKDNTRN